MNKTDIVSSVHWTAEDVGLVEFDVPLPCSVPWENMKGDDKSRLCQTCDHHVYNFSSMDAEEIAKVLNQNQEKVCIQLYKRNDGKVISANDCKINLRNIKKAYKKGGLMTACLFVGMAVFMSVSLVFGGEEKLEKLKKLEKDEEAEIKAEEAGAKAENERSKHIRGKMVFSYGDRIRKIEKLKSELKKTQDQIKEITKTGAESTGPK